MLSTCSKTPPKKNRGQFSGRFWLQGSVKRVDFYDQGRTAVALVMIAGREQQLVCDLPGAKKRHAPHRKGPPSERRNGQVFLKIRSIQLFSGHSGNM